MPRVEPSPIIGAMLLFIGAGRLSGETLHCIACEQLIARSADVCRILGRPPRRTYVNPHGLRCPLVTLSDAEGLWADTFSSAEHTWFAGYAWRPVACGACHLFLGWRFESGELSPSSFYGLLEERLVAGAARSN